MGISYGTWVAQEYARTHPRRTESLILDSIVGPEPQDAYAIDGYARLPRVFNELCSRGRCQQRDARLHRRRRAGSPPGSPAGTAARHGVRRERPAAAGRLHGAEPALLPRHVGRPEPVHAGAHAGRDERRGPRRPRARCCGSSAWATARRRRCASSAGASPSRRAAWTHSCRSRSRATRRRARRSPTARSPRSRRRRTRRGPPRRCRNTSYADDCLLWPRDDHPSRSARPAPERPRAAARRPPRHAHAGRGRREGQGAAPEVAARHRPRQRPRPGRQRRHGLRRQGAGALHGAPHGRPAVPQHVQPAAADPARPAHALRGPRARAPSRAIAAGPCSRRCAPSRTRASPAWRPSTAAGCRAAAGCAAAASPRPTPSRAR